MTKKYYQLNQYIKSPRLRVIDEQGNQLGVLETAIALEKAQAAQLDLVVVAEKTDPPVAKITDFQKFKYQQAKKERSGLVKSKSTQTKEVRLTPFIASGDLQNRLQRIKDFLKDGYRVKLVVKFVGRQLGHKDFGDKVMSTALDQLTDEAVVEQAPKWQGKFYIAQLRPKTVKQEAKINTTDENQN